MTEQQPEAADSAAPTEPSSGPLDGPAESALPDGFHEPQQEWSTEQQPGHIESTRGDA